MKNGISDRSYKPPPVIIDSRGYVLRKKVVSKELKDLIDNELIVKPELTNDFGQSEYFKVYTEEAERLKLSHVGILGSPVMFALDEDDINRLKEAKE